MKIKFLGAHNTESKNTRLVSLLIDDTLAVDAGSLASELTFSEQKKVKSILLSHGHYDHIKEVPSFGFSNSDQTTNVYGTEKTLKMLSSHLFDGGIYPKLNERTPFFKTVPLKLITIKPYTPINIEKFQVTAHPVKHTITSVGFEIISKNKKKMFYTGDTGPGLSNLWKNISPHLIIIDTTFSNRSEDTAKNAKHLCPNLLKKELIEFRRINKYFPKVILNHLSPKFEEEIRKEIKELKKELNITIDIASEDKEFMF